MVQRNDEYLVHGPFQINLHMDGMCSEGRTLWDYIEDIAAQEVRTRQTSS